MADGRTMIKEAVAICQRVAEGLGEFAQVKGGKEAKSSVEKIGSGLDNISSKLFFRTREAMAFASTSLNYARTVEDAFNALKDAPAAQQATAMDDLLAAVDDLENDHNILQAKVASQDIIIT